MRRLGCVIDYLKVYSSGTIAVTGVAVAPTTLALAAGATQQLTATVSPSTATNKSVTWSSSNTAVATVSSTGVVTALASGTATITARTVDGDKTANASVTATVSTAVASVAVSPASITVNVGATYQLTATINPTTATNKKVTWRSANNSIATVSSTGLVTAIATGNVAITATSEDGAKTSSCNLSVAVPVSGVTISPTSISLTAGATQAMTGGTGEIELRDVGKEQKADVNALWHGELRSE